MEGWGLGIGLLRGRMDGVKGDVVWNGVLRETDEGTKRLMHGVLAK